jgi:hypothetical protein
MDAKIKILTLRGFVNGRLKRHRDALTLWQNGYLTTTEPDPEEREAIQRELKACIKELELIEKELQGGDKTGNRDNSLTGKRA